MANTPRLGMPELAVDQANKYITHNESLRILDALVQLSVEDKDLVTSPVVATSDEGKTWIVAGTGGDWSAFSVDDVAHYYNGAWYNYVPDEGWLGRVKDEDGYYFFNGSNWVSFSSVTALKKKYVSALDMNLIGFSDPDLIQVKDNGSSSRGIFTYGFDASADEELIFNEGILSDYTPGDDIDITVQWSPTTANTGTVVWGLEYSWTDQDEIIVNTTIISVTDGIGTAENDVIKSIAFSTISGTGKTVNSILKCRIFRDADNGSDTYADDAALMGVRIEY